MEFLQIYEFLEKMTRLSVNVNKIATLRNARGGNNPDVEQMALCCELFGAEGITVHPRPDERHIRKSDVRQLKKLIHTELNIEGYPSEDFLSLVLEVVPAQATLVPDAPDQLTSNHGWDTRGNLSFLSSVVSRLKNAGIRVSLFVDPDFEAIDYAKQAGADRIELYTGPYAAAYAAGREQAIAPFAAAASHARAIGLGVNAGHDLSLENLHFFHQRIPETDEVSIGHALISDALMLGMRDAIGLYKKCLE